MLKKLMIGAALAAMIGAPAMAQSWNPSVGSGNIVGSYTHGDSGPRIPSGSAGYGAYGGDEGGSGAYAFAPDRGDYGSYHGHRYGHRWNQED